MHHDPNTKKHSLAPECTSLMKRSVIIAMVVLVAIAAMAIEV